MAESAQKLAVRERVGYACGDIATNFFFQSMILYQTRFYTDTVGLSAVAVGSMFLVLRLADAFSTQSSAPSRTGHKPAGASSAPGF